MLSPQKAKQIDKLLAEGLSNSAISVKLSVGYNAVVRRREAGGFPPSPGRAVPPSAPVEMSEPDLHIGIKKALKRDPLSAASLADALDVSPKRINAAIKDMRARGALIIETVDGRFDLSSPITSEPGRASVKGTKDEWTHVFGIVSDNHLCNKHSRLDVLNEAYDFFEREGISTVYNAGNWIDGEARFNKQELVTAPGMDRQLDYLIDKYPVRKGVTTHYIAGDDHEGWYAQREGVEIGRYLQYRAEDQGRRDLKYIGYGEADVRLEIGSVSATMRVVHPGGGSAYAISYTDQKRVESYQGGEKPQVEVAGHYHKWNYGYPREVHTVQPGCTCDQTLFMRKKRLQAMVGFATIKIKQDLSDGHIVRFSPEWFARFDRGFYEKRF
jgi:biotin operon repressor